MASKTITLSEDAYLRLKRLKRPGESFSDVVRRLTGKQDLSRFAGTISAEFADELRRRSAEFRERFDRDAEERLERLRGGDEGDDGDGDDEA